MHCKNHTTADDTPLVPPAQVCFVVCGITWSSGCTHACILLFTSEPGETDLWYDKAKCARLRQGHSRGTHDVYTGSRQVRTLGSDHPGADKAQCSTHQIAVCSGRYVCWHTLIVPRSLMLTPSAVAHAGRDTLETSAGDKIADDAPPVPPAQVCFVVCGVT